MSKDYLKIFCESGTRALFVPCLVRHIEADTLY